jgi:hypothetical protein
MTGSGPYAWMIGRRFEVAAERLDFTRERLKLRTDLFVPPVPPGGQLNLFSLDPGALGVAPETRDERRSAA